MRQQVEQRTGGKVEQHLVDGGYLRMEDIVQAHRQEVELFVPPKPAKNPQNRGYELEPKPSDSEAIRAWKQRMASQEGQNIYQQRAATSETVNADLRTYRGLTPLTVRGLNKITCVTLWCALAYNVMHFSNRSAKVCGPSFVADEKCGLVRCRQGRGLQRREIRVLDCFHSMFETLLLDRLHLLEGGGCIFGVAGLAVEARQQVVDGTVVVA